MKLWSRLSGRGNGAMVLAMVAVAAVACAKRSEAPSAKASEAAPTPVML